MHGTPLLVAEIEDKLDTMLREQRKVMRRALIRTHSMSGSEIPAVSGMDSVRQRMNNDALSISCGSTVRTWVIYLLFG